MDAMMIGDLERNATEVVRVSAEEFKGRKYIDIRIHFKDSEGEWKPTKKGVTVQPDRIDELIGLLKKAQEQV
jgi:hypothetical protein